MRIIEVDGLTCRVDGCLDCPCFDDGDDGYGCCCKHPARSTVKETFRGRRYRACDEFFHYNKFDAEETQFWDQCPLREVKEC